jgi:TetR/AcrR family transcriptional regulator, transcriptional repressor of aconitase
MPRLKESTRTERRQHIAAAALRCFARQGFAGTSMADIIAESGLSAGSIYSHFESKADLMRFVASDVLAARLGELAAPADGHAPAQPSRVFARLIGGMADRSFAQVLLQVWAEAPRDPELIVVARENVALIRATVTAMLLPWATGRAAGAAEADAMARRACDTVMLMTQGYVARLGFDEAADPGALRAALIETLESAER